MFGTILGGSSAHTLVDEIQCLLANYGKAPISEPMGLPCILVSREWVNKYWI